MKTELQTLIKAGYPLLSAKTQEPLRFMAEAAAAAAAVGRRAYQWDAIRGLQEIGSDLAPEVIAAPRVPEKCAEYRQSVIMLQNYHFWVNQEATIQALLNWLPFYKSTQYQITLIIVGPGFTPAPEIEREIREIKFSLPDREELGALLDALAEAYNLPIEEEGRELVIDNMQGLTLAEAENALAWAAVRDKGWNPQTVGEVKGAMVEKSSGLTFSQFTETLESLIGNDNLKGWALNRFERRRAWLKARANMKAEARGKLPPFRGILLLGKPGNGKSHFAKALGRSVGWRTVCLDLGRIFGGLVGESEANMERALAIIDAIAPCILFIDELEKALAGAGGGQGTNETSVRVGAKFLQWLQDHESEVFVVATCNDIKALSAASDGAYVRPGRWDACFFVDNPTVEQGQGILDLYLQDYTGKALKDYPELPELRDYSGAEIRQVAIETAYRGGDLAAAAKFVKPMAKTNKDALDALTKWAQGRTEPAHLPEKLQAGARAINLS